MQQQMFADMSFEQYRKTIRRERFLEDMNRMLPWGDLAGVQDHTGLAGSPTDAHSAGHGRPPAPDPSGLDS